jgi:hypothetical protein
MKPSQFLLAVFGDLFTIFLLLGYISLLFCILGIDILHQITRQLHFATTQLRVASPREM